LAFASGGTNFDYYRRNRILQEKGSAKRIIKKGDVIKSPPNIPHWHGASKDEQLIQIAITGIHKGATVWLQQVTEESIRGLNKTHNEYLKDPGSDSV